MDEGTRTPVLTVRAFLDAELSPGRRIRHLDELCARVTKRHLDSTVEDLRTVLSVDPIDIEDFLRLHVLISHLYHARSASIPLVERLRDEVNAAVGRTDEPAHPADTERR